MIGFNPIPNAVYFPYVEVSRTIEIATSKPMGMVVYIHYALPLNNGLWEVFMQSFGAGYGASGYLHTKINEPRLLFTVPHPDVMHEQLSEYMNAPRLPMSNDWTQNSVEWRPLPESKSAP